MKFDFTAQQFDRTLLLRRISNKSEQFNWTVAMKLISLNSPN